MASAARPRDVVAGLALIAVALGSSLGFGAVLLAELYARYGSEVRSADPGSTVARRAGALAVRLLPKSSAYRADYAWSLGAQGDLAAMRDQQRRAIRLAPANAYRWLEYEQLLSRHHRFDRELQVASMRVRQLAPNSEPIQIHNAWIGVNYWNFGDAPMRASWALSLSHVLAGDPKRLLKAIVDEQRDFAFCGFAGAELGLTRWCATVARWREVCEGMSGSSAKLDRTCQQFGLSP